MLSTHTLDPATAIVAASIELEHARIFRHLLWQRLGTLAIAATAFEGLTRWLPLAAWITVLVVLSAAGAIAPIIEHRAKRRLLTLLKDVGDL